MLFRSLAGSRVVLLGCGGIGSLVAITLATAGVGELILVDGDHVEPSNLTRQFLFTEADVGLPKAEVLARKLRRRNSSCQVRPVVCEVAEHTRPPSDTTPDRGGPKRRRRSTGEGRPRGIPSPEVLLRRHQERDERGRRW